MTRGLLIAAIVVSVGSKNLYPYLYDNLYFQGNALAWLLLCGLVVYLIDVKHFWTRKIALVLFWWAVSDVVEMCFMDRTAFDVNEYVASIITILIILFSGKRKKDNGRIQRTGY